MDPKTFSINDYLNREFDCTCGRKHRTALKDVIIQKGALENLPKLLDTYGRTRPMMVCD